MSIWWWIGFNALVLLLLVVDLGVFHRDAHEVKPKEAAIWSAVWITLALLFNTFIYFELGKPQAVAFLTGYLIEKSLSVDNLFVFVLIFGYFKVPAKYQHRILFWGIIGALVMRASLILVGSLLIARFHWVIYIFGAFLIYTGIRMALEKETTIEIEANPVIKLMRRWFPVSERYHDQKFFLKEAGRFIITPMLIVLMLIESTDLVFALDSIPAIFAVTHDTFIVYTSNIFAILGLRSLYFLLANIIDKFYLLKYGLAVVLSFIGTKMVIEAWVHIDMLVSLAVVAMVLTAAIGASLIWPEKKGDGVKERN
ncbi:MAG: Integral rane protein TerC [Chlorobi bacterium]|nr:Integral rane protein TerC [Chlorobiota bacterium]